MEALKKLALEEAHGDASKADALLADADERLRLEQKLRAAEAARNLQAWKALRPRAALALGPVVVAFAVGLSFGGGLGLLRVDAAPAMDLVLDARAPSGPYRGEAAQRLTFEVPARSRVVVSAEGQNVDAELDGERGRDSVLAPGVHFVQLGPSAHGPWSVSALRLEARPAPEP